MANTATAIISLKFNRKETHFSEVQCENPGAPANGYAQGSAPYRAGDVVQFNCNPEYMMQGQPIIACQDNGRWSGGLPKCKYRRYGYIINIVDLVAETTKIFIL